MFPMEFEFLNQMWKSCCTQNIAGTLTIKPQNYRSFELNRFL